MHKASPLTLLAVTTLSVILAGCASTTPTFNKYDKQFAANPPTTQWLEDNVNNFRETAWETPSKDNIKTFALVKGLLDERLETLKRDQLWNAQTHRIPTMDCFNEQRGGAAIRQAGYRHVVANKAFSPTLANLACSKNMAPPKLIVDTDKTFNKLASRDLSFYSMNSWKKYCNNGEGMTDADWDYINSVGAHNIPKVFIGKCFSPK